MKCADSLRLSAHDEMLVALTHTSLRRTLLVLHAQANDEGDAATPKRHSATAITLREFRPAGAAVRTLYLARWHEAPSDPTKPKKHRFHGARHKREKLPFTFWA